MGDCIDGSAQEDEEEVKKYGAILQTDALELGKSAEHIVCADLMLAGYRTFLTDQGLPYDVVVDINGRLIRIQVKSTTKAKNANTKGRHANFVYVFHVRSRGRFGKGERLNKKHCDIIALVALDTRIVAYFAVDSVAQSVSLYPVGYKFPGKYKRSRYASIDGFPFEKALDNVR